RRLVKKNSIGLEPGGAASLTALCENVVNAIVVADGDALKRASITRNDFCNLLWPEFPQSRPATHVTADEAWKFAENKNLVSFNRTAGDFFRNPVTFVSVRSDSTMRYTNFTIHTGLTVNVKTVTGEPRTFTMIRSVVERKGRFKIYST